MIEKYSRTIPSSSFDTATVGSPLNNNNSISAIKQELPPTPISLAGAELNKVEDRSKISMDQFKKICRKHGAPYKRVLRILGWEQTVAGFKIKKR